MLQNADLFVSGIYQIRNEQTGDTYIGSSHNIAVRWASHVADLTRGAHASKRLQRAWDRAGAGAFTFTVIERIQGAQELARRERELIAALDPVYNTKGTPRARKVRLGGRKRYVRRVAPVVVKRYPSPISNSTSPAIVEEYSDGSQRIEWPQDAVAGAGWRLGETRIPAGWHLHLGVEVGE